MGVSSFKSLPITIMSYTTKAEGQEGTLEYRLFFEKDGQRVSPFHDIPLAVDAEKGIFNMVVEIPKNTRAKLEISKEEAFNPIKQDVKNGKLRFVEYGEGYMWNYGAFPQTWEDPSHKHPDTDAFGDKDPLDVCEIGSAVAKTGDVKKLNDIDDVEKEMPGYLHETYVWFRDYKGANGNKFAFEGKAKPRDYALKIIEENSAFWKRLVAGE